MTAQLSALKQEVNNLVESFSEVEDDLDPNVYKMFSEPLNKVMSNMQACSEQMENMSGLMRLMSLLAKYPQVKMNMRQIERWEQHLNAGGRITPGQLLDPVQDPPPPPDEDEEEDEFVRAAEEAVRPTVARAMTMDEIQRQVTIMQQAEAARAIGGIWTTMPGAPR